MNVLIQNIIDDLTSELSVTDANFNGTLLAIKVRGAAREVKQARKYPSTYTTTMIDSDIQKFYGQIRNIALYDYNNVGAEFQTGSTENSVTRNWVSRDSLFVGVVPLATI